MKLRNGEREPQNTIPKLQKELGENDLETLNDEIDNAYANNWKDRYAWPTELRKAIMSLMQIRGDMEAGTE